MTVSELSAVLARWPVLRCSQVEIEDEHGRRYAVASYSAGVPSQTEPDGRQKPAGVPVLRLVIRELSPAPGVTPTPTE